VAAAAAPAARAAGAPAAGGASRKRARGADAGAALAPGAAPPAPLDAAAAAERLARTLFVGGVPAALKRSAVARFCARGAGGGALLEHVRLRSVPITSVALAPGGGFRDMIRAAVATGAVQPGATMSAYAVFATRDAAAAALKLNGELLGGARVRVDWAAPPSQARGAPAVPGAAGADAVAGAGGAGAGGAGAGGAGGVRYDPKRTVFVGNLPFDATDAAVRAVFAAAAGGDAGVEGVRVVRDRATRVGKGFAFVLLRERALVLGALALDGRAVPELHGRALRVTRATADGAAPPAHRAAAATNARRAGAAPHMGARGAAHAPRARAPLPQKGAPLVRRAPLLPPQRGRQTARPLPPRAGGALPPAPPARTGGAPPPAPPARAAGAPPSAPPPAPAAADVRARATKAVKPAARLAALARKAA